MGTICTLLLDYKRRGDNDILVEIINLFDPLLNKYSRISIYEDMKNDLVLFMVEFINNIDLDKLEFREDKFLVSYIHKSIKYRFMYINKKQCIYNEINLREDSYIDKGKHESAFSDIIYNDFISTLTDRQKIVVNDLYLNRYTESEVARKLGVSRQAINKVHRKALNHLSNKI